MRIAALAERQHVPLPADMHGFGRGEQFSSRRAFRIPGQTAGSALTQVNRSRHQKNNHGLRRKGFIVNA